MKYISGYVIIAKLLLGIYWLVMRQWCYLGCRRLVLRLSGRRSLPTP